MSHDWIQRITRPAITVRDTPDAPDRGEFLIALTDHFWHDLKANLRLAVQTFMREPGMRQVEVRDEGTRLRVNGDGYGVEICLEVEHEQGGCPVRC